MTCQTLRAALVFAAIAFPWLARAQAPTDGAATSFIDMPAAELRDKIRGGLLGQLLGNLNGLPHEFKYIAEPGNVTGYVPALPEGAVTDDDTDFEWVYIVEMQRENTILLPPATIAALWKERINRRIWCANEYARQLMDLGLEPPMTGQRALNPWAEFNISGQFLCETFALLAPAMPQTAGKLALHYTTVAIDGEPAQTTQLFTTMIAAAFVLRDVEAVLDAGLRAIDPHSQLHEIAGDVRRWQREHPEDWRATRQKVRDKYTRHEGKMRDSNGYELNTAATLAALLYGQGELPATLQTAFNFGWDCDNSAATSGTIVGVMTGYSRMMAHEWQIVDRYRNTTRDGMPMDETITRFADRLIDLSEQVIGQQGGERRREAAGISYRIPVETPACVRPLLPPEEAAAVLAASLRAEIETAILGETDEVALARAAYLAVGLDLAPALKERDAARWERAVAALNAREKIVQAIFHQAVTPAGDLLRAKARAAGLVRPPHAKPLW